MALAHVTPPTEPDSFVQAVARNIRALLALRGLKAQDLAEAIGMKDAKFSQRMGGHSRWLAEDIHRIARAFGVDADVILAADEREFRDALSRSRCSLQNRRSTDISDGLDVIGQIPSELPGQRRMAISV